MDVLKVATLLLGCVALASAGTSGGDTRASAGCAAPHSLARQAEVTRTATEASTFPAQLGSEDDWVLYWEDEFNGGSLNTSNWTPKTGTHGPTELEYYLPSQVTVEGGNLVLTTVPQEYHNHSYISGWVQTQGKFSTTYGRWEVFAQLPFGKGMWPAHWLMPESNICWPMGGEIDIMEALCFDMKRVHANLHYSPKGCGHTHDHYIGAWSPNAPKDLNLTFHTYGAVWNETTLAFYVDSDVYHVIDNPGQYFPQKPFYWILNTAVGGGAGHPDASTVWPQHHRIDYVRVYKTKASTSPAPTASEGW